MKFKIFNKKAEKKIKNEHALKHGIYSTAFIAVVLAAVVLINILATTLYNKYPIEIDLTSKKLYSLSEENIDFIKKVDNKVTVYVWAKESDFTDGTLESYFQQSYYYYDSTGKFFSQLKKNLDSYEKYNKNIEIVYIDTNSPEATDVKSKISDEFIYGGDLLVTATVKIDGKDTTRTKHILSSKLFTTQFDSTNNYYSILSSNLENDLSAAINYVTSEKISKVAFLKGVGDISVLSNYKENLELNGYETEEINNFKDLNNGKYDAAVIAAPTKDLSETELDILDSFLDNGGKKGRTLITFGNPATAETPNYSEFLAEWGMSYGSGTVTETDENYHYPDNPYAFFYTAESTDYTATLSGDTYLISADNSPIEIKFEKDGERSTAVLAYSNDTAAVRPKNAPKNWKAAGNDKGAVALAAACEEKSADGESVSTVMAFSSTDIANVTWTQYSSIANTNFLISTAKYAIDRSTDEVNFSSRTIVSNSISSEITEGSVNFLKVIFIYVLPLAVVATGIIVFVKRKNR